MSTHTPTNSLSGRVLRQVCPKCGLHSVVRVFRQFESLPYQLFCASSCGTTWPLRYAQDRDTGYVSPVTEDELRRFLTPFRCDLSFAIKEIGEGLVLKTTWVHYAADPASFRPVVKTEEFSRA